MKVDLLHFLCLLLQPCNLLFFEVWGQCVEHPLMIGVEPLEFVGCHQLAFDRARVDGAEGENVEFIVCAELCLLVAR